MFTSKWGRFFTRNCLVPLSGTNVAIPAQIGPFWWTKLIKTCMRLRVRSVPCAPHPIFITLWDKYQSNFKALPFVPSSHQKWRKPSSGLQGLQKPAEEDSEWLLLKSCSSSCLSTPVVFVVWAPSQHQWPALQDFQQHPCSKTQKITNVQSNNWF